MACYIFNLSAAIKWTILLFHSKDSKATHLLGDFVMIFGPKAILNTTVVFISIHLLIATYLFKFCSRIKNNRMMFYWRECLEYDFVNRYFSKLNLNESDSKKLTKRVAISILIFQVTHLSFTVFYAMVTSVTYFIQKNLLYEFVLR